MKHYVNCFKLETPRWNIVSFLHPLSLSLPFFLIFLFSFSPLSLFRCLSPLYIYIYIYIMFLYRLVGLVGRVFSFSQPFFDYFFLFLSFSSPFTPLYFFLYLSLSLFFSLFSLSFPVFFYSSPPTDPLTLFFLSFVREIRRKKAD